MEIVGYDNKDKFTHHLKEATLTCSIEELKEVSAFINEIIKEQENNQTGVCRHFRDYKKDWDNKCSDLIVLLV